MGMNLEEIEALLNAATPGPWEADTQHPHDCVIWGSVDDNFLANVDHNGPITPVLTEDEHAKMQIAYDIDIANARLIAAAPMIIRELVERVRLLKAALVEIKTGEVEVWDDSEEQIIITNMDEEEMQKIAADALDELAAKEST